jgi:hypothetical protein
MRDACAVHHDAAGAVGGRLGTGGRDHGVAAASSPGHSSSRRDCRTGAPKCACPRRVKSKLSTSLWHAQVPTTVCCCSLAAADENLWLLDGMCTSQLCVGYKDMTATFNVRVRCSKSRALGVGLFKCVDSCVCAACVDSCVCAAYTRQNIANKPCAYIVHACLCVYACISLQIYLCV